MISQSVNRRTSAAHPPTAVSRAAIKESLARTDRRAIACFVGRGWIVRTPSLLYMFSNDPVGPGDGAAARSLWEIIATSFGRIVEPFDQIAERGDEWSRFLNKKQDAEVRKAIAYGKLLKIKCVGDLERHVNAAQA